MKKKVSNILLGMFLLLPLLGFSQQDKVLIQGDVPHLCGTSELHEKKMKEDPVYKREVEEKEERLRAYESKRSSTKLSTTAKSTTSALYTIPVVFHVVHTGQPLGDPKNPTDAQIQNKIADLNKIFRGTHPAYPLSTSGGVDTEIEFQLVSMSSSCTPLNGIDRINASNDPTYAANGLQAPSGGSGITEAQLLAKSPSWANTPYMHIWLVTNIPGGVAGYAYLSSNLLFSENMSDLVLTHELGHALGLYHTFEGGCTNTNCTVNGDKICDTDPHTAIIGSCTPSVPNSCTGGILGNLIYNWMNYGNCQNRFTAGQATRMKNTINANLSYLINPQSTLAPVVPNLTVCINNPVSFTVQNPVSGATYNWYNSSGVPLQSSPSISYTLPAFTTAATYNYSVQAINNGCTSPIVNFTINVINNPAAPVVTSQTLSVGQSAVITVQNPVAGIVYNWYDSSNTLLQSNTSTSYQTSNFNTTGIFNYTVRANAINCVSTPKPFTLTVIAQSACPPVTPCDLVNNGDFEQYSSLPNNYSQINRSCGWLPAAGSPDYFHGLSLSTTGLSIPCNNFGYETDRFGPTKKAYAGIASHMYNNQYYTEDVYTQLNQTLLPNTDYTLTFDLSLAEYTTINSKINVYLDSNTNFISSNSFSINMSATTGLFLLAPINVSNTNGWTTVTFNFNTGPKTGLKYLVLGGISPNPTNLNVTPTTPISTSCNIIYFPNVPVSYYYIDNVSLKKSDVPTVNSMVICPGNTATLTITNQMPGVIYNWYATQTGTTILGTGTSFTTPVLTASTSFWVEAVYASGASCRGQVLVTVDTLITTSPILNYTMNCNTNQATIVVTNPSAGAIYNWYATQTSTTILASGTSFMAPVLSVPTTYWVGSSNACNTLPRVAITITVNPIVAANTTICSGNTATLTLVNPQLSVTYNWYATQTSTLSLGTGTSFTTPILNASTSYWVGAVGGLCRSQALVTVNVPATSPILNYSINCTANSATIVVTNPSAGAIYNWYATQTSTTILASGTSFTTPALSTPTTYWVGVGNACNTIPRVAITVDPLVQLVATIITICLGNTATFNVANPISGVTYKWYTSSNSTTSIYNGINFTTPALFTITAYWVEGVTASGSVATCRSQVFVTVIPFVQFVVPNPTTCTGNTATLSVSNPQLGITYKWYTSQSSPTSIGTGTSFTTPALSTTTSYWAEGVNTFGTVELCRNMVTVTVTPSPYIPTPVFGYSWNCASNYAMIFVNSSMPGTTHSWYATQTSTTILATGNTFTTPVLSAPTTYWVGSSNACYSLPREAITVTPIQATCTNVSATQNGSTITATVQGSVSAGATASYVWTLNRPNSTTQTQTTTTNSVSFIGNTVVGTYNITVNVNATLNTTTCTSTCGTTLNFCTSSGGGFYTNSAGNIPYSLTGTGSNQQIIEHFQYNGTFNPSTAPVTYTWTLINGNGTIQATATTSSNTWDYTYPSTFCLGCGMTIQCVAQMNAPYSCSNYWSYNYVHGSSLNGGGGGVDPNPCESNPYTAGAINATPIGTTGLNYQFKANPPSVNGVPITTSYTSHWFISYSNVNGVIGSFITVDANTANYTFPSYGSFKVVLIQFDGICGAETTQIITVRKPKIVLDPDIASLNKNTNTSTSFKVNLSPNPTNDGQVVIYWKDLNEEVKEENLIVTDLRGVVLHKSVLTTNPSKVDLGKLASGTYLYHLTDTNGTKLYDGKLVISEK